jgi:hypothetical protein
VSLLSGRRGGVGARQSERVGRDRPSEPGRQKEADKPGLPLPEEALEPQGRTRMSIHRGPSDVDNYTCHADSITCIVSNYPLKWHLGLPRRHPDSTTPCAPQCEQKWVCFFALESLALALDLPR